MSISLCITSYNEDYSLIYNLLEEVQKQEALPAEIIFYCSGMQSVDISNVLAIKGQLVPIRTVFSSKKTNQATARNICSKIASSEYVMFFDVDDIPHPMKIYITRDVIRRTNIDFFVHDYHQVKHSNNFFEDLPKNFKTFPITEIDKGSTNIKCGDFPIHHSHVTVKKKVFEKIEFNETDQYYRREDGKFLQDLVISGYSGLYCPIKLVNYVAK